MRALADRERIERFRDALGREARRDVRVYWVGGTTAVVVSPGRCGRAAFDWDRYGDCTSGIASKGRQSSEAIATATPPAATNDVAISMGAI